MSDSKDRAPNKNLSLIMYFGGIMVERVENWPFAEHVLSFSIRNYKQRVVRKAETGEMHGVDI